ncbi:MAG: PEP-CTERM sorting domain-containing protein, partial [Candidatus Methylopumilus sp.]
MCNCWEDESANTVFAAPVPEPETYQMMLLELGLMEFAVNRRKLK